MARSSKKQNSKVLSRKEAYETTAKFTKNILEELCFLYGIDYMASTAAKRRVNKMLGSIAKKSIYLGDDDVTMRASLESWAYNRKAGYGILKIITREREYAGGDYYEFEYVDYRSVKCFARNVVVFEVAEDVLEILGDVAREHYVDSRGDDIEEIW